MDKPEGSSSSHSENADIQKRDVSCIILDGIVRNTFVFDTGLGYPRVAQIIKPEHGFCQPGILFLHWYEPEAKDSNRTQFVDEAVLLAQKGFISLLIETMWSDRDWFYKRTHADDHPNSVRQIRELELAVGILLSTPEVDPERIAYVGHDFGAMYGVVLASTIRKPHSFIFIAGTPRLSDWYLYYPNMAGSAREFYMQKISEFDPLNYIQGIAPCPILFQFGTNDPHVPRERAEMIFSKAGEPKEIRWYNAGHALNAQATLERIDWLEERFLSTKEQSE
jgi:dienelactone hydrolase